jgi:hypothetical protein
MVFNDVDATVSDADNSALGNELNEPCVREVFGDGLDIRPLQVRRKPLPLHVAELGGVAFG